MTRTKLIAAVAAVAMAAFASAAMADTVCIGLQEGGGITTEDCGTGTATFAGPFGTFDLNEVDGTAAPFLTEGRLDSTTLNVSSSAAGTLNVYVTAQGVSLAGLPGMKSFLSSMTQDLIPGGWTVKESSWVDSANGMFMLTTPLSSATFTAIGTDVLRANADITNTLFSITELYTITATGSGSAESTMEVHAVPEPGSLGMLGFGLLLIGGLFAGKRAFR